ncbi:MAG: hypothetical protein Q9188_001800 [Gyalolechia gomerana]
MNKDESKGETSDRDESQKSSSPSRGAEAGVVQTSLESAAVETDDDRHAEEGAPADEGAEAKAVEV